MRKLAAALAVVGSILGCPVLAQTSAPSSEEPLPRARPEEVGMSSERLARIGATLKADVERGQIPGAVIAIARRGKLV